MNLHEYQSKKLLGELRHPGAGRTAWPPTPTRPRRPRARSAAALWVVKAQVHAGGRGKAGGVKLARELRGRRSGRGRDARPAARHQADRPRGTADRPGLRRGGLGDRARAVPEPDCSTANAAASPSSPRPPAAWTSRRSRTRRPSRSSPSNVHPAAGLQAYQCRELAFGLGLDGRAGRRSSSRSCTASTGCTSNATRAWSRSTR